jgi:cysteine synthase
LPTFPGGIDYYITGVGTGRALDWRGARAEARFRKNFRVFVVELSASAVISGGKQAAAAPSIQGIGAGFIPANLI